MQAISSLEELLEVLPECSGNEFVEISKGLDLNADDFEDYAFWDSESYTRNCLARTDTYELILLCWEKGQDTPIHDHDQEECWVYGLHGVIQERRYQFKDGSTTQVEEIGSTEMSPGSVSYMHDTMGFHCLQNIGSGRAMTLHLYINPIDSCQIYIDDKQGFVRKELQYTSLDGNLL